MLDKQEDMSKYERGKIYKIVDNTNNNIYIGSTIQTLKERLRCHEKDLDSSSKSIIDNGDYDILLIENYPCESKKELEAREGFYIRNNDCININVPGRTQKEYYQDNREQKLQYQKEYKKNNPELLKESKKKHYIKNKEKILEQQKTYVSNNKEKVSEYKKEWCKKNREYQGTWGGRTDLNNNSLLKIDPGLFNQ